MFQLTAARRRLDNTAPDKQQLLSFNSQPPEGGWFGVVAAFLRQALFQLTAARRRLALLPEGATEAQVFQLTAARRRLVEYHADHVLTENVSTHSRPKAAGPVRVLSAADAEFQLTAARRRLAAMRLTRWR